MTEPDWDHLYPAEDWHEAIKRILESEWFLTLRLLAKDRWVAIIHSDVNYLASWRTVTDAGKTADRAVMNAYKKWRDEQLKDEEDEEE